MRNRVMLDINDEYHTSSQCISNINVSDIMPSNGLSNKNNNINYIVNKNNISQNLLLFKRKKQFIE